MHVLWVRINTTLGCLALLEERRPRSFKSRKGQPTFRALSGIRPPARAPESLRRE